MEAWREKAHKMLPELDEVDDSDDAMGAWIHISMAFDQAYEAPRNEVLIQRIYGYADWCSEHGERTGRATTDLPTCIAVCFYENIPTREASRQDMPRWFSRDDILLMKDTFSYHLNPDEFERLLEMFPEPQQSHKKNKKACGKQRKN